MKNRVVYLIAVVSAVIIGVNLYQECFGLLKGKYKKQKDMDQQSMGSNDEDSYEPSTKVKMLPNEQVYSNLDFEKRLSNYQTKKQKDLSEQQYKKLIHTKDAEEKKPSLKQIQSEMLNYLALHCILWACKRIDVVLGKNSQLNEHKAAQKVNYILTKKLKNITSRSDRDTVNLAIPYCIYEFAQGAIKNPTAESFDKMEKKSLLKQGLGEKKKVLDEELVALNKRYQEIRNAVKTLGGTWVLPKNLTRKEIVSFFK